MDAKWMHPLVLDNGCKMDAKWIIKMDAKWILKMDANGTKAGRRILVLLKDYLPRLARFREPFFCSFSGGNRALMHVSEVRTCIPNMRVCAVSVCAVCALRNPMAKSHCRLDFVRLY